MQFTEEEINHLQRSLDGIPRIPTPPLEPSQRSETSTTTISGMERNYSRSIPIQANGTSTRVTTTAGFSKPSVSYSMLPKDGAIRASLAHSPGGLVPPQIPSTNKYFCHSPGRGWRHNRKQDNSEWQHHQFLFLHQIHLMERIQ